TEQKAGGHVVHSLGGIHFKANPHAPGVEYMVGSLGNLLAGQGATPTELLKIIDAQCYPRIFQASKTVKGKDLQSIIVNNSDYLHKINPTNFSLMIVLSLLTDPQDGKPDNYFVEFKTDPITGVEELDILGIDNDIAFADPIVKDVDKQKQYYMNIKNVLYFFPQMEQIIAPDFRKQFLQRQPELMMIEWLHGLCTKNYGYNALLKIGFFSQQELSGGKNNPKGLQLPIRFTPRTLTKLYKKLVRLQQLLNDNETITHKEMLEQICPELAAHYAQIQKQYPHDIMKCIHALYEEQISNKAELNDFQHRVKAGDTQCMTESVLKTTRALGFEDNRTQDLKDGFTEILQVFHYEQYKEDLSQELYIPLERLSKALTHQSVLHFAVQNKLLTLVEWLMQKVLLAKELDINAANDAGYTALHIAVGSGNLILTRLLLEKGQANIHLATKHGKTALDMACSRSFSDIVDYLKPYYENQRQYETKPFSFI
ncbi:MAG: ankyrin repeat domain-containing protein, partial [Gammaproteobacteria bacterium]